MEVAAGGLPCWEHLFFQSPDQDQGHQGDPRSEDPQGQHAAAHGEADGRYDPQAGGGGESFHRQPFVENGPGPQEPNAADHLGSDPGRITSLGMAVDTINGNHHQEGGSGGHQHMGPEPCRPVPAAPLQTDEPAQERSHQDPQRQLGQHSVIHAFASLPRLPTVNCCLLTVNGQLSTVSC